MKKGLSGVIVGLLTTTAWVAPAWAQEAGTPAVQEDPGAEAQGEDIVVTGIRASLDRAIDIKRKMYFEYENAPYNCLEVEVSKPTARGGQTLVRVKMRNLLTRALGVMATVAVEVHVHPVAPDDLFLLCSDGLTDMVSDEKISLTLGRLADNLDSAAEELVRLANEAGGKDNVSVVLARANASFARGRRWYERLMEWF